MLCLVTQLYPTLPDPMGYIPLGSSVHGDSPGKNTGVGCHALLQGIFPTQGTNPGLSHCRWILYHLNHQGSPRILEWVSEWVSEVTQSCPTLCDPMDCSLPGLSLHGISQSRILEWVAYPFSRRTSWPRNRTRVSCIASGLFTSWAIREAHMKCKNVNSTENYKEYK